MRRRSAIQLITASLVAGAVWAVEAKTASHLSSYTWKHPAAWFGGFSAVHVYDQGQRIIALSDRSTVIEARIERDRGQITGVTLTDHARLLSSTGRAMSGTAGDSEGIAVAPDGSYYVSFEGIHRVAHYTGLKAKARVLPRPKTFDALNGNGSFEALAMDSSGSLYTLPEKNRTALGDIPVYRWDSQGWSTPFTLPQRGKFLPVAADFGPDGRFYLLERAVGWTGFRSRLRRWLITGDVPRSEEILFETTTGTHDNLEGLSIWRDDQQRLHATMISDDNFLALQRTELVEYLLPD